GSTLAPGEFLSAKEFTAIMQFDCNFVLYNKRKINWASNTINKGKSCYLHFQLDGNLVIKDISNTPIWALNLYCQPQPHCIVNAKLILEGYGNLVLYG
ncbi:hypothetical protein SELMODRAFT_6930, partial [Selaginella moellendorffii]